MEKDVNSLSLEVARTDYPEKRVQKSQEGWGGVWKHTHCPCSSTGSVVGGKGPCTAVSQYSSLAKVNQTGTQRA